MRVFDTRNKKQEFSTLALDPNGRWLAAGGRHGSVVWDMTAANVFELPAVLHLRFLADGRVVHTDCARLDAFDPASRVVTNIWTSGRYVTRFAIDSTGSWLVCAPSTEDFMPQLVAVERPAQPGQRNLWTVGMGDEDGERGYTGTLECLGDGERFLSAENIHGANNWTKHYRVAIRSRADGRLLADAKRLFTYGDFVFASPASEFFVVLSASRMRVHRVDDLNARPHEVKNDGRKYFTAVAFHPSGQFLMAASNDATVKLYDTRSWAVVRTFTWDIGRMRSVTFSADGTLAAAGSDAGKVVVWDVDV